MLQNYGGYIWSDDPAYQERSLASQGLSLGVVAGLGIGVGVGLSQVHPTKHTRPIDALATMARTLGNATPWQVGNTFRVSEFLSPYTSPVHQGMDRIGTSDVYTKTWSRDQLQGRSTFNYLKELSGLDNTQLRELGIDSAKGEVAADLVFERSARSHSGTLYTKVDGKKRKLASNVALFQFSGEGHDVANLAKPAAVNKAVQSVLQAMNMWKDSRFKIDSLFLDPKAEGALKRPGFIPVPALSVPNVSGGVHGAAQSLDRSTTLLRAFPAFSMGRFNRLIEGAATTIGGDTGKRVISSIFGTTEGVVPGTGMAMYGRFGKGVGLLLAGGTAIAQTDWMRREFGSPGELVASAGVSAGVGYLAQKAGLKGRTAMMAGVASFFGQMVLPGFDEGVVPGLATTYANTTVARASAFNPVNYYRRSLEGYLPGVSDWKTGALLGVGALGIAYGPWGTYGKSVAQGLMDKFGHQRFGLKSRGTTPLRHTPSVRQTYWDEMYKAGMGSGSQFGFGGFKSETQDALKQAYESNGKYVSWGMRKKIAGAYLEAGMGGVELSAHMNKIWSHAEETRRTAAEKNPLNQSLLDELDSINAKHGGSGALRQIKGIAAQWKYSVFGAEVHQPEMMDAIKNKKGFRAPLGRLGLIFGGTLLMHQVVTGGLAGSMETSQDLREIYSGEQLVSVGKSRWWEMGGTPFEGSKTEMFRPHWYALMKNRVRQKGIWGEDEDDISPVGKFLRKNFTYELERRQYYDRPYPISSGFMSDMPIVGGIISSTIGMWIKPPKLMHAGEWMRPGEEGMEYASVFQGARREPAYGLGAPGPGVPVSPFSASKQLGFMSYQFRELEGLTGFVKNVFSDKILGTDRYATGPELADAGQMTSLRRQFWEMSMGGGFFMNEAVRRIFPSYDKDIERRNPIMNTMPGWMPDKFRHGDPYRALPWGEARMPGAGYAALHPELKGLDPEDYPLVHRYNILANIAPFSKEFIHTRQSVYRLRGEGGTSEQQNQLIDRVDEMVRKTYNIYDFDRRHERAIQLPGSNLTQAALYTGQDLLRETVAPAEYLLPMFGFRPVQKLMGDRQPIERYEYERLYGTPMAFWDKLGRDWFRPAAYSAAHMLGYEGKPQWRKEADENAAYFDKLEFVKWMKLAEQARAQGDGRSGSRYEYKASQTRFGVNPQGSPLGMYWSLPSEERAFFNAFAQAKGADRERIMQMIPEDQVHLYQAVWARADQGGDPMMWAGAPIQPDKAYLQQQYRNAMGGNDPMPPEDWIGYHCLPIGQEVLTTLTSRSCVDKIQPGNPVWQSDLSNEVLEVFTREVDEKITEVYVERDRVDSMQATDNHKVLAWKSPWKKGHLRRRIKQTKWDSDGKWKPEWIRIGDLKKGDYLVIPCPGITTQPEVTLDLVDVLSHVPRLKYDENHIWVYYKDKKQASICARYLTLTPEVAWCIGYYLAEGHVGKRNGYARYVEWTSHLEEYNYRATLCDSLDSDFGVSFSVASRIRTSGSSGSVRANGIVAEVFQYFAPGIHDTKKLMHGDQLLTSQEHAEKFLMGLYAGDGSKKPSSSTLATTSKELQEQTKELLISCGVSPSVSKVKRQNTKDFYLIRFTRSTESGSRIHDGLQIESHDISGAKPKAFIKDGFLYSRIGQIKTRHYKGPVFDMCVNNVHAYRSAIGLYHNSDVDISDIRVRYVNEMGKDLHDYGLWENELKKSMSQPYLEGSTDYLHDSNGVQFRQNIRKHFDRPGAGSSLQITQSPFSRGNVQIEYDDDREHELRYRLEQHIDGY